MALDIILTVFGGISILVGIAGCILPILPGSPLCYIGILLLHFTSRAEFSLRFLIVWAVIVVLVQVLDYYVPLWGTKKFGGSRNGIAGSMIGLVLGIFFIPPWGIILFPFLGAVIGELMGKSNFSLALKAGFGSFVGFLAGTVMKLVVSFILAFFFVKETINAFF